MRAKVFRRGLLELRDVFTEVGDFAVLKNFAERPLDVCVRGKVRLDKWNVSIKFTHFDPLVMKARGLGIHAFLLLSVIDIHTLSELGMVSMRFSNCRSGGNARRDATIACASAPIFSQRNRCSQARSIARAKLLNVALSATYPVIPSSTSSALPPTSVTTAGRPQTIASVSARGLPSPSEHIKSKA